ncbi:acyl-CoA N-acyltransferase [Apiospora arundinis]
MASSTFTDANQQQHQQPPLKITGRTFDAFHSPRLTYRAAEETVGASYRLTTTATKATAQKYLKESQDDLLCAIIYLKPSLPSADNDNNVTATDIAAAPAPAGEKEKEPVPIGVVTLNANGDSAHSSYWAQHRGAFLSIDTVRDYRGKGYGGEAIEWALGFAFRMANMHRVSLTTFSYNGGAMRLYRKLGFVQEGSQREDVWFNGGWHDCVLYGMLEDEWRARQEGKERKWGE